jgi:hypothetical protein
MRQPLFFELPYAFVTVAEKLLLAKLCPTYKEH